MCCKGVQAVSLEQALENFLNDRDGQTFRQSVEDSTMELFKGSIGRVELLPDSTFHVIPPKPIGVDLYRSPGIILNIPQFDYETIDDLDEYGDEVDMGFAFAQAEDEMREGFRITIDIIEGNIDTW
jgi:hypothetical protein